MLWSGKAEWIYDEKGGLGMRNGSKGNTTDFDLGVVV
jgi:hypothetical protein